MIDYLRDNEMARKSQPIYLNSVQRELNETMRSILIDWLVEVTDELKLQTQTLFISVLTAMGGIAIRVC